LNASGLTTPFSSSSYATSFDSASRPVKLSNGATTYWATTGTAATGSYDPLGQILSAALDVTRVNQTWTYGASSALLSAESVRFGTAGAYVYLVNGLTYRGTKLSGFTDNTNSPSTTTYKYWYSNTGRLVAARATASGASPPAPSTLACLTYSATKAYGPGPSLGNIERTREGVSSPFTTDFLYSGTNVEAYGAAPHLGGPDAPTSVGTSGLGYDDCGRIVSTGAGAATFGYDLLGRMTSITQGGTTEKLYYDPFGSLVQRQVGTTVVSYVGRRATVTGTLASGCQTPSCGVVVSAVDFHVTLGAGRRIASVRVYGAARTLYYHRDRLGSVVATTRDGGLGGASYRYSANGALEVALSDSGDSASEIGYAGALRLSGGLLSMGARVYNPALKIWMQPDPLQPFKYDYADGDPINKIDPTGLDPEDAYVPAPDTPNGYYFDELTGDSYKINEEITVVAPARPSQPESLGIVGWGYSPGRSSEPRVAAPGRSWAREFTWARNSIYKTSLPGNLGTFYAGTTTRLLAGLGVPTVTDAIVTALTGWATGTLTGGEIATLLGVAGGGWVAAGLAGVVAVEAIVDIGAVLYATAPLVD
jgi:RHS repeat-associated protein